ncbi:phosphotransferase family protein [Alicyclobacillus fodiniaquatilis]|uniref:Phosphotransferase family protein n=1 Tax=Alicyclobacillus fodiniaquatilis TaxID=1661150 RepID=A0ABW4JMF8_9BACL
MDTQLFHQIVSDQGQLCGDKIIKRTRLYQGRTGRHVERFVIETAAGPASFVFKPSSYPETVGRELWLQQHFLPFVKNVQYPRILATSSGGDVETYWAIYEDAGEISHQFTADDYIAAAKLIPCWHSISVEGLPRAFAHWQGRDPAVIARGILANWQKATGILAVLHLSLDKVNQLRTWVEAIGCDDMQEKVPSHADYHIGNIGISHHRLIVLDWENAHVDSVYCDLYSLLDKTHPHFRKAPLDNEVRLRALDAYVRKRRELGWQGPPDDFVLNYFRYAVVHSIWMLLLICDDLDRGLWNRAHLTLQKEETYGALMACLAYLDG